MSGYAQELELPPSLQELNRGGSSRSFLASMFTAGSLHVLLILLLIIMIPKLPPRMPDAAIQVLVLQGANSNTDAPPVVAAALSQTNRSGDLAEGDGVKSTPQDIPDKTKGSETGTSDEETRLKTDIPEPSPLPDRPRGDAPSDPTALLDVQSAPEQVEQLTPVLTSQDSPDQTVLTGPRPETKTKVDAARILDSRGAEIARLTASLEARTAAYASRLRRRSVSASTREFRYASYLASWARKVENIGNINYPQEAKDQHIYGSLILHVSIRSDGTIEQIRVVRSSGHKVLDDAAIKIVKLAAPFSPFPPDIAAETDVLDIVRTWQFMSGGSVSWE